MKAATSTRQRARHQHPDLNLHPDSGVIRLDELVKDAKQPDRIPRLPFGAATLWRTIAGGDVPEGGAGGAT